MRATAILTFAAILAGGVSTALASSEAARMGFQDNKLNFKSCDGKNLTARWRDNKFHLSAPGKTLDPNAAELSYLGWDGSCQSVSVDNKGQFKHAGDGATDAKRLINYVTWDGTKWAATRAGTDFFVVFVADKDETVAPQNLKDAAHWLRLREVKTRAASQLAQALDGASGN